MKEANFVLFVTVLQKLALYFFATDHTNYARWLSVIIHDLETNPNLYREFIAGKFTYFFYLLKTLKLLSKY